MKKIVFILIMSLSSISIFSQNIHADHFCTDLSTIPEEWIMKAKNDLRIYYGHTSHGSQLTSGMSNLQSHIGEPYTFNSSGSGGALYYREGGGDLGHNGDTTWAQTTRNVINNGGYNINVVMWSWCGGCSDNTEEGINTYLNKMTELENDFPGVKFVYMTGHLDIWSWANLKARNQQIRDYCIANNKILFDFADIESYNPDYTFFEYANDNCNYYSGPGGNLLGNWATEWCDANPGSDLCWACSCAHSEALNCNLKGRAFWWMAAKMAGWGGGTTSQEISLNEGYQFSSSNISPNDPDMLIVLSEILNDNLAFARDSDGNMLRKIGPNWVNGIGDWNPVEGYLFKLNASETLIIEGEITNPQTPIVLSEGFQFVSYLPENSMNALTAFENILSDNLEYVRDSDGNMLRKIGPNWINGIGNCNLGEGYMIKMNIADVLVYPSSK